MESKIFTICKEANPEIPNDLDCLLIDEGYIDSFGVFMIATELEIEYGYVTNDNELVYDNFKSMRSILAFVCKKLEGHL